MTSRLPNDLFPIVAVDVRPAERRDELLGSKMKFWCILGAHDFLYKQGRENEDWSEKVASECARLFGIPYAEVDLAECDGNSGVISRSFIDRSIGDQLVHGNELLLAEDPQYPSAERYCVAQHTLKAATTALERLKTQAFPTSHWYYPSDFDGVDVFVGYILFDAWIGNSDRHHENWGVVQRRSERFLAPSYDHASSLGRNDPPKKAAARLQGNDRRLTIENYSRKCRSAFFEEPLSQKPLTTFDAAHRAATFRPTAGRHWKERLRSVSKEDMDLVFARMPPSRLRPPHRELARRLLDFNRDRLLRELP